MPISIISGQHLTLTRTALDMLGRTKADEADPSSAFTFTDSADNTWPFTMSSWVSGVATFTLTAPVVESQTTVTLNRNYLGSPFPASPPSLEFTLLPPYRGNFNLTGAILAWDGSVNDPGTDLTCFDFTGNSHFATAGDGISPVLSQWFTPATAYTVSVGGTPITMGRYLSSIDVTTPTGGAALALTVANGLDALMGSSNPMTFLGVFIREAAPQNTDSMDLLTIGAVYGINSGLKISVVHNNIVATSIPDNTVVATVAINDSHHYWDQNLQALCVGLTSNWPGTGNDFVLYFNGNAVASWHQANGAGPITQVLDLLTNPATAAGFAVADFATFWSVLSQPQIAAQAAAWGL